MLNASLLAPSLNFALISAFLAALDGLPGALFGKPSMRALLSIVRFAKPISPAIALVVSPAAHRRFSLSSCSLGIQAVLIAKPCKPKWLGEGRPE